MRTFSKVIIGVNVLMLVWLIAGLANTSDSGCSTATYQDACQTGADIGRAAGIGIVLFVAAIVNVILGVLWMVTRKPEGNPGTFGLAVSNPLMPKPDPGPPPGPAERARAAVVAREEGRMCPSGHENRPGALFCDVCGSKVLEPF